jgi:hypothetical protein
LSLDDICPSVQMPISRIFYDISPSTALPWNPFCYILILQDCPRECICTVVVAHTTWALCALMSDIEAFLQWALFDLDTFTNCRHYKYLGFKADRITCGWGHAGRVTATWKSFSAFPLVLVKDSRRDKMEGRGHSPLIVIFYWDTNK